MLKGKSDNVNGDLVSPLAIKLLKISKSFGTIKANKDINLGIKKSSIHGIIGENGAGKSTLVSILYGFYSIDKGSIEIFNNKVNINNTSDAISCGIGMVHQHFMLVKNLSILENIIIGYSGSQSLEKIKKIADEKIRSLSEQFGFNLNLEEKIENLPVGVQQKVEILKALFKGAKILILDEPTGVLTPQETKQLFNILKSLKEKGVTIIFITHKLDEIMSVTDYVSVMRNGKLISTFETLKTNTKKLAALMVGRNVQIKLNFAKSKPRSKILSVKNLNFTNSYNHNILKSISFDLFSNEILGIAGVSGNGQSELLEILSGIKSHTSGYFQIDNTIINSHEYINPNHLKKFGLAHVPEDRHEVGMVLPFKAYENSILGYENYFSNGVLSYFSPQRLIEHCKRLMKNFDVRPFNTELICSKFSGGNQQKLVLSREMNSNPKILLVGQPTRGVDIGAIEFIHKKLVELRDKGCAILLVSVELEEIFTLSDRIMVLNNGKIMGIKDKDKTTPSEIGLMMAGVKGNKNE